MRTALLFAIPLLWSLMGCSETATPIVSQQLQTQALGQTVQITSYGEDPAHLLQAMHTAEEDLHYVLGMSHPWEPGPLGRTNELFSLTGAFSAAPSGMLMLEQARELYQLSDGWFNPALGQLQRLWGLQQDDLSTANPATQEAIDQVLQTAPSLTQIHVEGIRMSSSNAMLRLDYGPFAFGYALDTARQRLREAGISQAQIISGNALVLLGEPLTPFALGHYPGVQLKLLANESVFTVAIADRHYWHNDTLIHPFIHPHNGQPVRGLASVTVLDSHGTARAAALAHALLVAGEEQLPALATRMGVARYLLQHEDGTLLASHEMLDRLQTEQPVSVHGQ